MSHINHTLLQQLRWHRCSLVLMSTQAANKAHPLSIGEAIIKGITEYAGVQDQLRVVFQWGHQSSKNMRVQLQKPIVLTVDVFGGDREALDLWAKTARLYFTSDYPGKNFEFVSLSDWQVMSLPEAINLTDGHEEVCLEFVSPVPFKTQKSKPRFWLDGNELRELLEKRILKCFGVSINAPSDSLTVLPYYWEYQQISHASHSQSGNTKYLNGCVGKLYLRADDDVLSAWLPWLQLAELIGVGRELSFGRGRCRLLLDAPAYFQANLLNPSAIAHTLTEVIERYDQALPELANTSTGLDEASWAKALVQKMQEGLTPEPFQTFHIPKANGKLRTIEKPNLTDLVVLFHLYAQLKEVIDHSFEEESIGFRKGMSRQTAIERIHQAIEEGYDVVLESDVADFFPSVNHDILLSRLFALIPKHDDLMRSLLSTYLSVPQIQNHQLIHREKGLPVGSPLSSLLANVYLDGFDKHIKSHGVKLIRYADDFVILTRGKDLAEALLQDTQACLQDLALSINLEKTAIRFIREGFTFLGIHFGQDDVQTLSLSPRVDSFKKPVYVTEPFTFLGVDGDALEIRKMNRILGRVPLKRISEVLTLAPASWSSALVAKCVEEEVPIVITSGNGRPIATFAGDSARHYEIAYRQADRFYRMSDVERLSIAMTIGQTKLANTLAFMKQRYQAGSNRPMAKIDGYLQQMGSAVDFDTLRGLEGAAAKLYFSQFTVWIKSADFEWKGRNRRPADRINSLLNFGYHLLFSRINVLVRGEGLNPYLSFLHEPTDRYESLVSDIQEVFRSHIDRMVIRLINMSMITAQDFTQNDAGFWLNAKGKETFLKAFAHELDRRPASNKLSLNEALALQVHKWTDFLVEGKTLQLYQWD